MTVGELITVLETYPTDLEVFTNTAAIEEAVDGLHFEDDDTIYIESEYDGEDIDEAEHILILTE